ncbi:MAG: DEAD/DEAH box helicase [Magnetococcales bacterium]|nr:DEAD/DEAH box helicase [Magnetococcales bacterium]
MSSQSASKRPPLLARFDALPAMERTVVRLVVLLLEPASRSTLGKLLRVLGFDYQGKRAFTTTIVAKIVSPLIESGLLVKDNRGDYIRYHSVNEIEWPILLEMEATNSLNRFMDLIEREVPAGQKWGGRITHFHSYERMARDLRFALFRNDSVQVTTLLEAANRFFPNDKDHLHSPLHMACGTPLQEGWLFSRSPNLQFQILGEFIDDAIEELRNLSPLIKLVEAGLDHGHAQLQDNFHHHRAVLHIFAGEIDQAQKLLNDQPSITYPLCLQGWIHYLRGENTQAIDTFEEALRVVRRRLGRRQIFLDHPSAPFYILALLKESTPEALKKAERHLNWLIKRPVRYGLLYEALFIPLFLLQNKEDKAIEHLASAMPSDLTRSDFYLIKETRSLLKRVATPFEYDLEGLFLMLSLYWIYPTECKKRYVYLPKLQQSARKHGFRLIAEAATGLMETLEPSSGSEKKVRKILWNPVQLVQYVEPWERALNALERTLLSVTVQDKVIQQGVERLIWHVVPDNYSDDLTLQPRLQKQTAKGGWTKGRNVSLKRLCFEGDTLPWMTDQDRRIAEHIQKKSSWGESYEVVQDRAFPTLVGHPLVFTPEQPNHPVEVVRNEPELVVQEQKGSITLTLSQECSEPGTTLINELPGRIRVIVVTSEHVTLAQSLGNKMLTIPATEKERVRKLLPPLAGSVEIQTNLGSVGDGIPLLEASSQPVIQLFPHDEGLKLSMLVRPLGEEGPLHQPGMGSETLIASVSGARHQTHRDLAQESRNAHAVIDACPTLAGQDSGNHIWYYDTPVECLELLTELHALETDAATVLWPEGESLTVTPSASLDALSLNVKGKGNWFHLEGEIQVDGERVIALKSLMESMEQAHGRFVPLGDGQYLTLTRTFLKRLEELKNLSEKRGRGRRWHGLTLPILENLSEEAGSFSGDGDWKQRLSQFEEAQRRKPRVPKTFEAEFRPYQKEGFQWLSRLAHWGAGACLADDMGLGKTLQTLALLVQRAPQGPALVVAPTSVTLNWLDEARRFSPTLNLIPFGSGDRKKNIAELGPFDVLVCSYGLMAIEAELLTSVEWSSIVLDESQAIKNPSTKRAKAVFGLNGAFRLATTGTPIENHLGELWSLFRFLNPGLLGSRESFNKRFAMPIEVNKDPEARAHLKRLLDPFILRRTKNQVLDDLPPRTEITLQVEPEPEERAFYEALRQKAVESLSEITGPNGQKRIHVLAEITRLRRACCHPALVMEETPLESAKLRLFADIVDDLRQNNHRALVFSQFVDHLSIIRRHLDSQGVPYQYLDGSTPTKKRRERVNAFQAGEGDLFLISLKAGGFGLNLTGADYVIHMDPWWNPAVEDQASDRAHRIGQTRPVTIYRLVTRDTIEEKIVTLHKQKRDLADTLLDGTHAADRITTDMLLKLMQE